MEVKTKRDLDWEFTTKTYTGRCRLAKDKTQVMAIFRQESAAELEAHIKKLDEKYKKHLNSLRALMRARKAEEEAQ